MTDYSWMTTDVWLVLRVPQECAGLEVRGVFLTEDEARAACRMVNDMIGPVEVGAQLPDEPTAWPAAYYPLVTRIIP